MSLKIGLVLFLSIVASLSGAAYGQASVTAEDREQTFYQMTRSAPREFTKGNLTKAAAIAEALLSEAPNWEKNWNYGNAVHTANIVLGRVALRSGEIDKAKEFLLKAGNTPGSPQLDSFGPDMTLARELLGKGETEAVLKYFDLCEKFWESGTENLARWRPVVSSGEIPDFGPNLRYIGF